VGLFETIDMFRVVTVVQVKDLLSLYNLFDKLIAYVKDKSGNLSTLAQAFTSIVNYSPLGLVILWQGLCFGHVFSKTCLYACNDTKIYVGFRVINLKAT
jgi:hypothetical protein